jgi:hypothetical protein
MKIRLYIDEDAMSDSLVRALRAHGVDVETAFDARMVGTIDEQQLMYATQSGRVLYSFKKKDFYRLHTQFLEQGQSHVGMILAQQGDYSVGEQMRRLLRLVGERSAEEMVDQVEFLSAWGG